MEMKMQRHRFMIAIAAVLAGAVAASCGKSSSEGKDLTDSQILAKVPKDVVNTAYYKDVFVDGGCDLNSGIKVGNTYVNGKLPFALARCGFDKVEYFISSSATGYGAGEVTLQNSIVAGNDKDENGVLLYPDGQARFRLFYSFGGHSNDHGTTLGSLGRARVNDFYAGGGSYVGSCAGAYLAGKYASGKQKNYYNIWAGGNMVATSVSNSTIEIEMTSKTFQQYYGPADGTLVVGARHNGGGYMDSAGAPKGTEVIALYRNAEGKDSKYSGFYGKPAVWAYKESQASGRMVVTGSHPEDESAGDVYDLTSSMFKYAWDGAGCARVKHVLHNGQTVSMTKKTAESQPDNTAIGDLQCHHFVLYLPKGVPSLSVELQGSGDYDLSLYLKKGTFAFPEASPDYKSEEAGPRQMIQTGHLASGLWFVTVKCMSAVTATDTYIDEAGKKGRYFDYTGKTGVLNGVPYTVRASW